MLNWVRSEPSYCGRTSLRANFLYVNLDLVDVCDAVNRYYLHQSFSIHKSFSGGYNLRGSVGIRAHCETEEECKALAEIFYDRIKKAILEQLI